MLVKLTKINSYLNIMFYWENYETNYNLFMDLKEKSLPKKGWIHSCINCSLPTGNLYSYYKNKNINVSVYICKHCIKNNQIPINSIQKQVEIKLIDIYQTY